MPARLARFLARQFDSIRPLEMESRSENKVRCGNMHFTKSYMYCAILREFFLRWLSSLSRILNTELHDSRVWPPSRSLLEMNMLCRVHYAEPKVSQYWPNHNIA